MSDVSAIQPVSARPEPSKPEGAPPRRILHLVNHLGLGGTERQLFLILKYLDRKRFESHIVVFNPSHNVVYDEALEALGVRVWAVPKECRGIRRRGFFLHRLMRRLRPHLTHSWSFHDNPYAGVIGRLAGCPVRWGSLRGSLHDDGLRQLPWLLRNLALHSVNSQLVNCLALREQLTEAGIAAARIEVLPNCVEPAATTASEESLDLAEFGIDADDLVVGIVGNLRRVKNHLFFLRAMARVLPERPSVKAVVVGQTIPSEPEWPRLMEEEIHQLGLAQQMKLLGFRSDVPRLMKRFAITCLTSHSEGMPNALLEAMAAGRPTVAVRVGGIPEVVRDGVSGLLVEPGDEARFAEAVARLLDDSELRTRMGREGLRLSREEHGCDVMAGRLADLYDRALGPQAGRAKP